MTISRRRNTSPLISRCACWRAGAQRRGLLGALLDGSAVLRRLRPDLLITYNWGAIEWAMADRLWGVARQMHFEAGFGEDEADRQIRAPGVVSALGPHPLRQGRGAVAPARGFGPSGVEIAGAAGRLYSKRRRCRALCRSARRDTGLCPPARRIGDRHGRAVAAGKEYRAAAARLRPPRPVAFGAPGDRRRRAPSGRR